MNTQPEKENKPFNSNIYIIAAVLATIAGFLAVTMNTGDLENASVPDQQKTDTSDKKVSSESKADTSQTAV